MCIRDRLCHLFAVGEAPDGGPIDFRGARVWGAIGVEGASHAHVSHDRETASQREAAQFDIRLARVRRVGIPKELGDFFPRAFFFLLFLVGLLNRRAQYRS